MILVKDNTYEQSTRRISLDTTQKTPVKSAEKTVKLFDRCFPLSYKLFLYKNK